MSIPVHEMGTRYDLVDYRPINHSPIDSRITERTVKNGLIAYLLKNEIINTGNLGFLHQKLALLA